VKEEKNKREQLTRQLNTQKFENTKQNITSDRNLLKEIEKVNKKKQESVDKDDFVQEFLKKPEMKTLEYTDKGSSELTNEVIDNTEVQSKLLDEKRTKWENGGKEKLEQWRKEHGYITEKQIKDAEEMRMFEMQLQNKQLLKKQLQSMLISDKKHLNCYSGSYDFDNMNGHEFEFFCADILRKNGFGNVSVTKGTGDQGVDILAEKDKVKYAIQCKKYSAPLSNKPIQEVYAGKQYYRCHVGVVMTNSTFTSGAKELAESVGVLTWDKDDLQKMIEISSQNEPKTSDKNILEDKSKDTETFSYKKYREGADKIDCYEVTSKIQSLCDNYIATIIKMTEPSDKLCTMMELLGVVDEKNMRSFGAEIGQKGREAQIVSDEMQATFMILFAAMFEQGFDKWSNEIETMESIEDTIRVNKKFVDVLLEIGLNYLMQFPYFEPVQYRALLGLAEGIEEIECASDNLQKIISEFENFKKDCATKEEKQQK